MLNIRSIVTVLGLILSKLAVFMWIPIIYCFFTASEGLSRFFASFVITESVAFVLTHSVKPKHFSLSMRDMFILTSSVWILGCLFGAIPIWLLTNLDFTGAVFETMSGLTTMGASVIPDVESIPKSVLLWRSILQWIGGIGFIIIAIAVLPAMNVGGMKLFRTEFSERTKDTPRTSTLAKNIVLAYMTITLLCVLSYRLTGMPVFDAVNHAFTTVATGGFSTRNASITAFGPAAQWISVVFMLLSGLPFILYVRSFRSMSLEILRDSQVKTFLRIFLAASLMLALWLIVKSGLGISEALRSAALTVASIITTTGYYTGDWWSYGPFAILIILLILPIGACSGSSSGGIKIFRLQLAYSIFRMECRQLIHPKSVIPQKYNGRPIDSEVFGSLVTYEFSFIAVMVLSAAALCVMGVPLAESITGTVSALANVGPGFGGSLGSGFYGGIPDAGRIILTADMMLGRLEFLTALVILFPSFWKG